MKCIFCKENDFSVIRVSILGNKIVCGGCLNLLNDNLYPSLTTFDAIKTNLDKEIPVFVKDPDPLELKG